MSMEVVHDPNAPQGQAPYMPQQQQYNPNQQYNPQPQPQQQPMAPPQPVQQPMPQQQQAPPMPQPQYQQPPQVQQPQPQQGGWTQPQQPQQQTQPGGWPQQPQGVPQGQAGSSVVKLQCTRKQMERMNLLMMDGYFNNVRVTNAPDGTVTRVGFLLAWESIVFENGQQMFNPDGTPVIRDVRFAMSAWGQIAQALSVLPVGTPMRVWASANRWNASRQGEQANWQTDFRVNRFEVL